jgi:16S rRNA (guanine527-N7)-methyltransferase
VKQWLSQIISDNNLTPDAPSLEKIEQYVSLLLEWNRKINLISRKDEDHVWASHILLSLSFFFMYSFPKGHRVLDLGTGGGLPGIPLSILSPQTEFTLLDSVKKKSNAVQSMISHLGLTNVRVVCSRAEDLISEKEFNHFHSVIARSVASLSELAAWSYPLLRAGLVSRQTPIRHSTRIPLPVRSLLALKGGDVSLELQDLHRLFPKSHSVIVPLNFRGLDQLANQDKKIIEVHKTT